ncbi:MAG: Hsp20/alpha crystallin family protein [Phycisphaerales bacterium]
MNLIQRLYRTPLAARTPRGDVMTPFPDITRVLDRFFEDPWTNAPEALEAPVMLAPAVDIEETDANIVIKAELPGVELKDIDVSIHDGLLTISGQKHEAIERKEKNFYRAERRFGAFKRVFDLPEGIDPSKLVADFENGVLTINVPKPPAARPRHIEIKSTEPKKQPKQVPVGAS